MSAKTEAVDTAPSNQFEAADPGPGRGSPLRKNSDFMRFWLGESLSLFGSQVTALALPLTAVLVFGAGSGELGILRMLQLAPFLLFGMIFGVWADRARRRSLMISANATRAALIGMVPLLAAFGLLNLRLLCVITFVVGIATVLFDVCWTSYVPTLVPDRRQLIGANGRLGATSASADVAGPGLAGFLIQVFTPPIALIIDAASYLVSIGSLLAIRQREPPPVKHPDHRLIQDLAVGMRFVIRNRYLRALGLLGGTYNFFLTFLETIFLVYAIQTLGLDPGMLGFIFSVGAVGGFIGAAVAAKLIRWWRIGQVYIVGAAVAFLAPLLLPFAGGSQFFVVATLATAFFFGNFGIGVSNVITITLRQAVTPPQLLGRMNAALRTFVFGLAALGAPLGGVLGIVLGLRPALWLGAVGSAAAVIPLLLSPIRGLRELPTYDSADPAGGPRSRGRIRRPPPKHLRRPPPRGGAHRTGKTKRIDPIASI